MYLAVNGTTLFFDVDGESLAPDGKIMRQKPTVVVVHGGPGADHSVSKPFFSGITDIAQVIYYDHRGNGRSDPSSKEHWNLAQWGDDLKGLCDKLGIEKPIVIGTSFGGFVAQSYATRHPSHVGGLVLISTAAKMEFEAVYEAFERIGGEETSQVAREYWENPTDEGRVRYREMCVPYYSVNKTGSTEWMSRILWKNETALWFNGPRNEHGQMDFREKLKNIGCPVLLMVGMKDPITPPEFSDVIASALVGSDVNYLKFPECGHGVVGDKPAGALSEIREFIGDFQT